MGRGVTILDVAKHAGVSKVTVSYVLNGHHAAARISPETRDRVLASARELNYKRNAIARMLVTKRSHTVAIVFQQAQYFAAWSSFTSELMRGVSQTAVEAGLDLMLHTKPATDPEGEFEALTDGRVDGLLMLRDLDDPTLHKLIDSRFPTVLFFTRTSHPDICYVDCDNYAGGRLAAKHLIDLGHRRITMVRGSSSSVSSNDRFSGYREAMENAGLTIDGSHLMRMPTPTEGIPEFVRIMSERNRPTAVFCWSDDVAFQCMRILRELAIRVPDDVSVVGYDSSDACDHVTPALTSVKQPIFEMAREASEMLVALVNRQNLTRRQIIYPPSLDIRFSTAPAPTKGQRQ